MGSENKVVQPSICKTSHICLRTPSREQVTNKIENYPKLSSTALLNSAIE